MEHDPGDEAMVNPSDLAGMSILSGEDIRVTQETTTTMAVQRSVADQHNTRRQIGQLAHCSAAAHQATVEQISQVQQHQDVIASKTAEYLQEQHDRQLELQEQQEQFRRQMAEQRKQIEEQLRLLKAAEAAFGEQGQRLQSLAEAVRPHVEARWGLFAQTPMAVSGGRNDEDRSCPDRTPTETQVTEDDWKNYFLDARNPDYTAYKRLDIEMRKLAMDVSLLGAESRMSRLLADFYKVVDGVNMESIIHEDPKRVVGYLVDALRPEVFRSAIKDNLDLAAGKHVKKDVSEFLRWLELKLRSSRSSKLTSRVIG
ncbi:hypothetical protein PInf_024275 [Phytophthora infestans]|nr:hypothetical protein PInf_024275 [Phytophthora infestans]